ncbi:MAG: sodium-dependent transporter [Brevibacterium sp.]|uniref:sodium-dependent transporter n=1 Tax=Brevibacterium sp. TaxID=1701 RepID=UPI002649B458|nr:sodium-dependent transporter [Brevibacterium sp.]MDN5807875.1 sodium-dependent transporter [Brevibacterium sp.]MDN5834349.1 sodium-dependent transporter [Brevibacterium sp.]MDN5910083.1 sodium-dependent transporter [Brevibacterium sp.]MDN6133412.1 sodium-dependent transporter [Brevibacterium sp.]MDN6158416.1 sodium-dependent transporter [Brevibacterium sp.]
MSSTKTPQREVFVSRSAFIFAAIGSAVGLGNIWRFPYVTYENGGGAFIIPYLVALLTAGIPLLFFYYAMGHRSRGSAPLAYRMAHKSAEPIGWFATGIAIVIGIYYAAIIGWAASYMFFSLGDSWGDDAESFFFTDYLKMGDPGISFEFVPSVLIPMIIIWVIILGILLMGVQKGIARFSKVFIPLLIVLFLALVIRALFLPGAIDGLNALFTPDFAALADPKVWIAAYGQIFFSLSIAFGIMITYASYLKKKTNLTGAGLVVGFSNSAFEILAGIGIFAALGFMASAQGVAVGDVATDGIGLAFVGFPTLISQMPGGPIFGFVFFACLVFAGLTSLISIVQVPIQALREKFGLANTTSTIVVGGGMAIISLLLMPTITGLYALDTMDAWANNIGIVGSAVLAIVVVGWAARKLPILSRHLNAVSSFKLGAIWMILISITGVVLIYMLITQIVAFLTEGYGDYPALITGTWGWGMIAVLAVASVVLSFLKWPKKTLEDMNAAIADSVAEENHSNKNKGA